MEEKNIALCILGIIAIIAVVGMIMLFTAEKAGAAAAARQPQVYPGGVSTMPIRESPSYGIGPGVQYYTSPGNPVITPANLPYEPVNWKVAEGQR